jgi:hypothetical protein
MAIKIKHSRKSKYIDPSKVYVGLQPSTSTGEAMRATFCNLMNWNQHGAIVNYSGRYDNTKNGAYGCNFYIVTPASWPQDPGQLTQKLGVELQCWDNTTAATTFDPEWNGVDIWEQPRVIKASATQSDNLPPQGEYFFEALDASLDNEADGYTWNKLSFGNVVPAALGVYTLPEYTQTNDAAYRLAPGNFNNGQTLRGDMHNSIGTIAQYQQSRSTDPAASLVNNTKRCLFQWVHPAGYQHDGAGSGSLAWADAWNDGNGNFKWKVKGRNLRGRTSFPNDNCDIVLVTRHDDGTKVRLTSAQTSDTVEITLSGTVTTPAMSVTANAFKYDPRFDEITVECYASTSAHLEIKSLSMWEAGTGDEI